MTVDTPADVPADTLGALVVGPRVLVAGDPRGPIAGRTGVVKDLFDVARTRTGAGNPDRLAEAEPATSTAPAVQRFAAAGVTVVGKSVTDELAYSLSGTNVHYGTPVNPAAPGRIPGGSSSGSASAVAGGLVDVALGTDTGGSVRVPSSWCGLYGMRPTHGRIPLDGVVPLAPSSDTVGWFARSGATLDVLGRAMLGGGAPGPAVTRVAVADDLFGLCDDEARPALRRRADAVAEVLTGRAARPVQVVPAGDDLMEWFRAYRTRQGWECWQAHGEWITRRRPAMGPGIAARFAAASRIEAAEVRATDPVRARVRARVADLVNGTTVLAVPVTMGPAPLPTLAGPAKDVMRARMLAVNCVAGTTEAPTVVVPGVVLDDGPVGLGLLGAPRSDGVLLRAAADLDGGT
jgi:amidase